VIDSAPQGPTLKDYITNTMTDVGRYNVGRRMLADPSVRPIYSSDKSATGTDIALLVSMLFLQRFSLPFSGTALQLELVAMGFILFHQFISGKLLIQYDRLLWFLGFAVAITCSLLLNFKSTMLTGYFQFMMFFSFLMLSRRSSADQYRSTLQAFQFVVMLLSCLGVVQFLANFVLDSARLMNLYGILPDFLLGRAQVDAHPYDGSYLFRSNAIFLSEASTLSQITALGILIEVLEFRRPKYLLVMMFGFLVSYSGTGSMLLLLFLPLAGLHGRAAGSALLVVMFALGLFATGIIELSAFTSRVGEFEDARNKASGFVRFASPFWLAAEQFDMASLQALLLGNGPGTGKIVSAKTWYTGGFVATWLKLFYEYGIIGSFMIGCFLASCLRRSRCPGLVVAAIIFAYVFLQGIMTITIVLCTLNSPEPRRGRIDETSQYRSSLTVGSAAG
jgi:hypothetical protein